MWLALQLTLLTVLTFDIVCITFGFTLLYADIIYSFTFSLPKGLVETEK